MNSRLLELNTEQVGLLITALAELANSPDIEELCEAHRDELMAMLSLLIMLEDDMVMEDGRKPEDIINDQFDKFIRGV